VDAGKLSIIVIPRSAIAHLWPRIEIAQFWHERYHRDLGHKWLRPLTFELFARPVR
jgi:hypothetical protein